MPHRRQERVRVGNVDCVPKVERGKVGELPAVPALGFGSGLHFFPRSEVFKTHYAAAAASAVVGVE